MIFCDFLHENIHCSQVLDLLGVNSSLFLKFPELNFSGLNSWAKIKKQFESRIGITIDVTVT